MTITPEIQDRSEKIQTELQEITEISYKSTSADYQDCMNVAIFTKMAELELKIEKLENEKNTYFAGIDPASK